MWERIKQSFLSGTSDIDWCEPNYQVTPAIAEFYNTISNSLFIVLPPFMIYLYYDYGRYISKGCHLVWALLIMVGIGSAYFHGTLSLVGQLVDELAILWVSAATLAMWIPRWTLSSSLDKHRGRLNILIATITILGTLLGCVFPVINNIVLMVCAVPMGILVYKEAKSCRHERSGRLGLQSCILWIVAVALWISDRIMCGFWIYVGFPYLHSIWHVIMVFSSYGVITFMALRDTEDRFGHLRPCLAYWPWNSKSVGLPYIKFRNILPTIHTNNNRSKIH